MIILQSPGDILFSLSGFNIYWYGIIMACAVLVGIVYADRLCYKFNIPANFWVDNSPLLILSGLVGARLYYCALNFSYYVFNPLEIFDIRQGGLSIHGTILFGLIILFLISKRKKINILDLTDCASCAIPLAQSIGRWGNFFNNEAFGLPTNIGIALRIPIEYRPEQYLNYELFHPAFLYESIADIIVFFIILFISKKTTKKGIITVIYLILYSIIRIIIEQLRIDSALYIFNIPIAQIVSILIIISALIILLIIQKNN